MNEETRKLLREPFSPDVLGKLPRVWCGACRQETKNNRRQSACSNHKVEQCRHPRCRNRITDAHIHLDYVGHAEVTDRFLTADPEWTWEPLALDQHGLPAFDQHNGLWIKLTIAGTTRLGYGAAEGKDGPDAVKEIIGDALRNAGMRFGVALDLWGAKFKDAADNDQEPSKQDEWDAATPATAGQARVFDDFVKQIQEAKAPDALTEIAKTVHIAKASNAISKWHYDQLVVKGAARRAELEAS